MGTTHDPATVDISDFGGVSFYDPRTYPSHSTRRVTGKFLAQLQRVALNGNAGAQRAATDAGAVGVVGGTANGLPHQVSGIAASSIAVSERWLQNYCFNDFRVSQRTTPTTLTTIADQGFGSDRWKQLRENADLQYRRYSRGDAGSDFTGLVSESYARFSKATSTGKFQVYHISEKVDAARFRGNPAIFRIKLRSDASRTVRMGLVEWTSTADTLTAAMVSAWGANSTDPTLAASYSRVASVSCAVTTTFKEFTVTGSPSSSCNNLILVIWTDSQVAASGYIEAAEPYLALASIPRIWVPRPIQQELALCQRYCLQFNSDATGTFAHIGVGDISSTTSARFSVVLPVPMRIRPSLSYSALSDFIISAAADGDNPTGLTVNTAVLEAEPKNCRIDATMTASSYVAGQAAHFVFSGVASKFLRLDAEL